MGKTVLFIKYLFVCTTYVLGVINTCSADDWEKILDLEGKWKFSIGDETSWSAVNCNDAGWDEISVPSSWENQGFHGYDGYAWYRKSFQLPAGYQENQIYLSLGYIDDVDEVYVNGQIIGFSGSFPPKFKTAYNAYRMYLIPKSILRQNQKNVIAVRVYDTVIEGGIVSGDIGIFINHEDAKMSVDLHGIWEFRTGDDPTWNDIDLDTKNWNKIMVPSKWEHQGFAWYDGFAWYRKQLKIPSELKNKELYLILGYIDDYNQVFINGKLIASTGMNRWGEPDLSDDQAWVTMRVYRIPQNTFNFGKENTISIRVYDKIGDGGIYKGPAGIITQSELKNFQHRYQN